MQTIEFIGEVKMNFDLFIFGRNYFRHYCLVLFILLFQSCGLDTNVTKFSKTVSAVQNSCYHPNSSSFKDNKNNILICSEKFGPCEISVCKDERYNESLISETYRRYIETYGGELVEDFKLCKTLKDKSLKCAHPLAKNYQKNAKCIFEVCGDDKYFEYQLKLDFESYLKKFGNNFGEIIENSSLCKSKIQISCCSHPDALNYYNKATLNAKCDFNACLNKDTKNYNAAKVSEYEAYIKLHGGKIFNKPELCGAEKIKGCTLPGAVNYVDKVEIATACEFKACTDNTKINFNQKIIDDINNLLKSYEPGGSIVNDPTLCGAAILQGCKNSKAINYNASANIENGSCNFQGCLDTTSSGEIDTALQKIIDDYKADLSAKGISYIGVVDTKFGCKYAGCMQNLAKNYNSKATEENGSCAWEGCIDPTFSEYNEALKKAFDDYRKTYPSANLTSSCSTKNALKVTRSVQTETQNIDMKLSLVIDTSASMSNVINIVKNALVVPLNNLKTQNGTITVDLHDFAKLNQDYKRYDYFDELGNIITPPNCTVGSTYYHCGGSKDEWIPVNGKTRVIKAPFPVYSFLITKDSTNVEIENNVQLGMAKIKIDPLLNKEQGLCYLNRLVKDNFLSNQKNVFIIISDENDNSEFCIQKQDKVNYSYSGYYQVGYNVVVHTRKITFSVTVNGEIISGILYRNVPSPQGPNCLQGDIDYINQQYKINIQNPNSCSILETSSNGFTVFYSNNESSRNFFTNYTQDLCKNAFIFNGKEYINFNDYISQEVATQYQMNQLTCYKVQPSSSTYWNITYESSNLGQSILAKLNNNIAWTRSNYAFGNIIFNENNHACTTTQLENKVHGAKYISLHNNLVGTQHNIVSKVGDICSQNYEELLNDIIFKTFKKIVTYSYLVADKTNLTVGSVYLINAAGERHLVPTDKYQVVVKENKTFLEFDESYSELIAGSVSVEINYYEN